MLIVSLLGPEKLEDFLDLTKKYGIEALVEVHDEQEFKIALNAGAKIIGVNNRNLSTFEVTLDTSLRLAKLKQKEVVLISESGIKTSQEFLDWLEQPPKSISEGITKNNTDSNWASRTVDL